MIFTSLTYFVFLASVFLLYWQISSRTAQNALLCIASFVFYGWWSPYFCVLMVGSSFVDFAAAHLMVRCAGLLKKIVLAVSLSFNVGLLCYFKYYNFFISNLRDAVHGMSWDLDLYTLDIVLPVGISFYTFQTMSYAIDVYRGSMRPVSSIIDYTAYVGFFPQLVAGPIERAPHLIPQFLHARTFSYLEARDGCRQILWGCFKKLALADNFAVTANLCFGNPEDYNGIQLFQGVICFALQIYCDFSAYSDIAVGSAKLFGFQLMRNFAYPYFSQNVTEFWRRWHISLSTWFRDYLYFPLGGNRRGRLRNIVNVMITFIISGVWHGAAWNYVLWGAINGALLCVHQTMTPAKSLSATDIPGGIKLIPPPWTLLKMATTFLIICATWILFRVESLADAWLFYSKIWQDLSLWGSVPGYVGPRRNLVLPLFLLIEWIQRDKLHPLQFERLPRWCRWLIYTSIFWLMLFLSTENPNPFIYFQF